MEIIRLRITDDKGAAHYDEMLVTIKADVVSKYFKLTLDSFAGVPGDMMSHTDISTRSYL